MASKVFFVLFFKEFEMPRKYSKTLNIFSKNVKSKEREGNE